MYEERLLVKESPKDYIMGIVCFSLIYAGLLSVSVILLAFSVGGVAGDVLGITLAVVLSAAYIFLLAYCIFSMRKNYFEFYDDRVAVLSGNTKKCMIFYSDIEDFTDCGPLGLIIKTQSCYHFKHGELNGERFNFGLSRDDKEKVLKILRVRAAKK